MLHTTSFGLHKQHSKYDAGNLAKLDSYRRVQHELSFLDSVVKAGTQPEIAFEIPRLHASLVELSSLVSTRVESPELRMHATATLKQLGDLSRDAGLQADCSLAVALLARNRAGTKMPSGIVSSTRAVGSVTRSKATELTK